MDFSTDDNNNASAEKTYSLRPRTATKREREDFDEEHSWRPRGRTRRKQKQKSAPLSKYRRKTANARERSRMREINDAFEVLRKSIPHLASTCDNNNEKVSKIMTLRLAMKYITALSNALEEPESYTFDFQTTLSLMDNSSTTSSLSDHGTWREPLFNTTPPVESSSTVESPLSCSVRNLDPTPISRLDFNSKAFSSSTLPQVPQESFSPFFTKTESSSTTVLYKLPLPLPPHQPHDPSRHTLTPPDESALHLPEEDFQITSGNSDFQNSSSLFTTEFDGLPSPVMDFCDLFIT